MKTIYLTLLASLLTACATSPTGRKQLILIGDEQMNKMGVASFQKLKTSSKISNDKKARRYVECVTTPIIKQLPEQLRKTPWEVVVFQDDSANAFALPGGKIGVHTGLLKVAKNQSQLASVLGHEVAHVIAKHGAERVSHQLIAQTSIQAADVVSQQRIKGSKEQQMFMLGLGLGAKLGFILPYSRKHESEADIYGLDLMANAGFDPRQSVNLWQNMDAASAGQRPPQFLSTHPEPQKRIEKLQGHMARAISLASSANQAGRKPNCRY